MLSIEKMENSTVLVTGAAGFIGSHLVELLLSKGITVKALVHYNSRADIGWLQKIPQALKKNLKIYFGDIRDSDAIHKTVKNCDYVFHLAALIGIPYSYSNPSEYVSTNIVGTHNILKACKENSIIRLVHISSSEVYGTAKYIPIDENHPLQGQSPYSATKISADKMVESYFCSFNIPVVTIRPFNTYGPRQSTRAVIPTIISQLLHGREMHLGMLDSTRDFTFVTDTAYAMALAAVADNVNGETINLGVGKEISIRDLAKLIGEVFGSDPILIEDPNRLRPENSEVLRLCSNNQKAIHLLKWEPKVTLREGLKTTIDWLQENKSLFEESRGIYQI